MSNKKTEFIFSPSVNEMHSSNDLLDEGSVGLEISVEYYDFSLDNFRREVLHWFKPIFNSGKLLSGVQRLVKKQLPEIKPEYIEVDIIPETLPFDDDNGDILSLLQICGLKITDWQHIHPDVEVTTLPLWHGEEEEIVLNFSPKVPAEVMQYVKHLHGWTAYTGITVIEIDESFFENHGLLSYIAEQSQPGNL
ncbi:hypothetical protein [Klebsiella sp. S69]|uniref:hypothetical protein n=1 Tax=Klebsiella sp. S69 TaxID=2767439 RepID=UPI0019054E9D|nr:hypothetical protein [Klebsiella sp. S69]MBK0164382.1 hypothetical protein [Klebsiella sp. S69]